MLSPASLRPFTGPVSYTILAGGKVLNLFDGLYQVHAITVTKGINRVSEARLELVDGDPADGKFPVTDSASLVPGTSIEVQAGYEEKNKVLFKGLVVGLTLATRAGQGTLVTVLCKDEAVKLAGGRVIKPFTPQTISAALQKVVGQYRGISPRIAATTGVQQNLVQYNATDWDFVVTQAEANGQVVLSDLGKLATVALATASSPAVALEYGTNVYDFSLRIDARTQVGGVTAHSWSAAQQQDLTVTAKRPNLTLPGNLKSAQLADAVGQKTFVIRTAADVDKPTLQALADAYLAKRMLALLQGTVDMPGSAAVVPGDLVSLAGLGQHFSGTALVSGVRHSIADGTWKTQLSLGTDEQWFAERHPDVTALNTSNTLVTGTQGLYSALVKAIQPDPSGEFRVQVTVAALAGAELWVRLAQPYASAGVGFYFYPEVGDEVALGFLGDDVRCPVILGALGSKKRAPAYQPDKKNAKKAIVTRSKLTVEFDDEKKVLTLSTPGQNKLVISDEAKGLTLTDQQGNAITLSDKGLALVSKSSVSITAAHDITLKSSGGSVTVQGGQQVQLKGASVTAQASTKLSLSGSAAAELKGGVTTTIKGGMVMIN